MINRNHLAPCDAFAGSTERASGCGFASLLRGRALAVQRLASIMRALGGVSDLFGVGRVGSGES